MLTRPLAGLLVVVCLASCGAEQGGPLIPASTVVLDAETQAALAAVSGDQATLGFARATALLSRLAAGNVLVSGVASPHLPFGLLRKVTAVTTEGDGRVTVTTTPARLTDAIERGSLRAHLTLTRDDLAAIQSSSGALRSPYALGPGIHLALDNAVLYDHDKDPVTTYDQVRGKGSVDLEPTVDFNVDIDGFSVKELSFSLVADHHVELGIEADGGFSFKKELDLATLHFKPIEFTIGPVPVVLVPRVVAKVGLDGSTSAKLQTKLVADATLTAGAGYKNGSWGPIMEATTTGDIDPPSFSPGLGVEAKAWGGAALEVLLYGLAGPYAQANGYTRATVTPLGDPWWKICAGIELIAGVKLDLIVWETAANLKPFIKESCPLEASGPGAFASYEGLTFASTLGGTNYERATSIARTSDQGYVFVGEAGSFSLAPRDALIVKVDALGQVQWQEVLEDLAAAVGVAQTNDGGYLVATSKQGASTGDVALVRLDGNGEVLWARAYQADDSLAIADLALLPSGDIVVAGAYSNLDLSDFWVARFRGDGTPLWSRRIGGEGADEAFSLAVTGDGGLVVTGTCDSFVGTYSDYWIVRFNGAGDLLGQQFYENSANDWGYDIALVGDALYVAGTTDSTKSATGGSDAFVFKLDLDGAVVWSRTLRGPKHETLGGNLELTGVGRPLLALPDGSLALVGSTESFGAGSYDVWLMRTSPTGELAFDAASGAQSVATGVGLPTGGALSWAKVTAAPLEVKLTATELKPVRRAIKATVTVQAAAIN